MKKFIVHRIEKIKFDQVGGALSHNLRTRIPDYVDKNRIDENIILGGVEFGRAGYSAAMEKINLMCAEYKNKSNSVILIESFYSISPEYIKNMDKQDMMNYFRDCTDFAIRHYGAGDSNNLISAVVHLDEQTPHLHVLTAPVVDGVFNAKKLIGGSRNVLRQKQTIIHDEVGIKYGLDRGISKKITGSTHVKNSEIQNLRRQVKLIPAPDDTEIADTSSIHYPDDPTKLDFFTGRAPGILSQQRQIFDAVFRELEGANAVITQLDSEREKLIKLVNKQAAQLAIPTEFIRRQLQEENKQTLDEERQRQRERRREAVRKWAKTIRGAQERAAAAQATAQQKQVQLDAALCRVPELVQQATEAEREKLQQERERIRLDRQRVDREVRQARQIAEQLEDERKLLKQQRLHYAQLSENVNAQIEDRLAERQADLAARLVEAKITEKRLQEQEDALNAAQDRFNEEWEKFQDERQRHGQQMEDWQSQYEAKLVDIRTREKIERVPRDAWIDDLPTAPVVERKLSPLPPRRGGGRGGPNPFAINKRPRPRR